MTREEVGTEQVKKGMGKNVYYIPFGIKRIFEPRRCVTYSKH